MSTDPTYPYVTDPTAVMAADTSRCFRCGTRFAKHGGRCGQPPDTQLHLPLSEADELRLQLDALVTEIGPLRRITSSAEYVSGPNGCIDPDVRDCEEYVDDLTGEDLPEVQWCSHVKQRHATYTDVYVRERLEVLLVEILGLVATPAADAAVDVRETIHATVYSLCANVEVDSLEVDESREPYKTIVAEHLAGIHKGGATAPREETAGV